MPGRIVLFGATGYTGRLTAEALAARGARPVLAGRSETRLAAAAAELGGLETAVADVERPESVQALVVEGDVLVATVGPFSRFGDPAVEAAIANRASYLDSTGEPPFIRRVFEHFGPRAQDAVGLVTAVGYDWVPGNLAAALALREAGERAERVDVGYFATGDFEPSGGTRASLASVVLEPHFAWRDGRLVSERAAARVRSFEVKGRPRQAVSIGSSEHLTLPRIHPGLREVNAYLGWFGGASRALQAFSAGGAAISRVPGVRAALAAGAARLVKGSTGGPDADARARGGSYVVAEAYGPGGERLAEVRLAGVDAYGFTADILAWGAVTAADRGLAGTGALGPVEAFGLDQLEAGCAEAGIERVPSA